MKNLKYIVPKAGKFMAFKTNDPLAISRYEAGGFLSQ
jgi:hypothetical protein